MEAKRLICVSDGTPQVEYVGWTDKSEEQIDLLQQKGGMLQLIHCRILRTILMPDPKGIKQESLVTTFSVARSGVRMLVKPTAFWWPDEDENGFHALQKLIAACEASEIVHRAKDAGLEMAGVSGQ